MYVMGNTGYFENNGVPKHWGTTFERFQEPADGDTPGLPLDFIGSRTGSALPICCPVHRNVKTSAASAEALKLGFCENVCEHVLPCGHPCSLKCHWPNKKHNSKCTIMLDSPCKRHPTKITCNDAFRCAANAPSSTMYPDIMNYFQCPVEVSITLPCGHAIKRRCHVEKSIQEGSLSLPKCKQPSSTSYVFPSCGHELDVTCEQLENYTSNPQLVNCVREVTYEPSCGHAVLMPCHRKHDILAGNEVYVCHKKVSVTLPRCGHQRKVPCPDSQAIASWSGVACEEVGKLEEGKAYGSQDFVCNKTVTIYRSCGHQTVGVIELYECHTCRSKASISQISRPAL